MKVPAVVLLVEDNPGDVELTRQGILRATDDAVDLHIEMDGERALAYLETCGEVDGAPWPELILLDLNLPRVGGLEVLAYLKSSEKLRAIPVVVLSTSAAPSDVARAYDLQCNAYVTKPVDFKSFVSVIDGITAFWLRMAKRPPKGY